MTAPLFGAAVGRPAEFGRIYPPDKEWLTSAPQEDILLPGQPIIDPHHHLWDLPGNRYLTDEMAEDISGGHNIAATVYAECLAMYRSDGPGHLRPVGETEFAAGMSAISASGRYGPARIAEGIIGYADLRLAAAVEEVLQAHLLAGGGRFKGIRFATTWDPSDAIENSHTGATPHLLADPAVREGLGKLRDLGLSLDVWVFFTQLAEVAAVADEFPDLTIVLDHCGGPLGHGPYAENREEHFTAWEHGVRELSRRPNVVCKVGGILGRGAAFDYLHAATAPGSEELAKIWRPWFMTCIEAFGADRCMFESNFPVEKMGTSYTVLWNTFKHTARDASSAERDALFAATAKRTYRL
jgi:L-fuconolactonase